MASNNDKRVTITKVKEQYTVNSITVKVGDTVIWFSEQTDFRIWFPGGRDPLSIRESNIIKAGNEFRRKVPQCATESFENNVFDPETESKEESYQYCIFCYENNTMAEGNSSPEMIIKKR